MSIKNFFFAPLASGLGATRRAAMLLLVMMLTTATAWAQDPGQPWQCGDNLTWELTQHDYDNFYTLTISGEGAMYDYAPGMTPWNSYASDIQTVVIGDGVMRIGNNAFYECTSLTSVTFAEGSQLTSIGDNAFDICSSMTSITIPASVTSIGEAAFFECEYLTSVTFAEGSRLESIGDNAFRLCSNLTSITIPASVTSIGSYVFQICDNLASITVEDGNTVFDSRNGCNAIIEKSTNTLIAGCKNSTIPAGVTSIGAWAFFNTDLTSIEIPASVTSIGMHAFQNCPNLATVTVYAPSCTLGDYAFLNCNKLENIYVFSDLVDDGYKAAWSAYADKIKEMPNPNGKCGDNVRWVLTGESTNYTLTISGTGAMADYASSSVQPWNDYRSSIKTVVIGNGVTSIGNYTFAKCTGLTSIEIPASVTSIGDNAFWECSNLATVTFAEDSQLATIGISAFSKCSGLASIEIPASVTSIGDNAFHYCSGLATVSFAAGSQLTSIGDYAFEYCSGLTSIEIPASVTSIGRSAFAGCSNLEAMIVDGGNTVFDSRNGCNAIIEKSTNTLIIGCKNSTIPAGVTSIGAWAFLNTGLTSIEIPASVTSIGGSAFYGCSGLTSIEIPASVTSIGGSAFYGCSGLTSIEIPASVTSISVIAFRNCSNLATVTVYAPSCTLGDKAFLNCDKLTNIYVFSNLVGNYKGAEHWSTYKDKITALPTVTTSYVDADGTLHEGVEAVPLNNAMTTLPTGTYVVNSDVAYTGTVTLSGDVTLILGDGKTMTVTNTGTDVKDRAIYGDEKTLHIYGQSQGTGALTATAVGGDAAIFLETSHDNAGSLLGIHGCVVSASTECASGVAISVQCATDAGGIVIDGGQVTASGNNFGIYCQGGHFDILGGQVTATGTNIGGLGICDCSLNPGVLTLGYSKATDFVSTNSIYNYSGEGEVKIATDQTLVDGNGNIWSGTLSNDEIQSIRNQTLRPVTGVTLTKDGNNVSATFNGSSETTVSIPVDVNVTSVTYNRAFTMDKPSTVMLPFNKAVSEIGGGTFYTFGGVEKKNNKWVATMNAVTGSLTANTPYLFVPTGTSLTFTGGATLNTTGGGNCLASDTEGWEFHGTYEKKVWDEAETHDYGFAAVSGKSVDDQDVEAGQFVRLTTGASAKPMRCYLSYVGGPAQARAMTRGAAATDEELPSSIIVRLVGANGQTTAIGTIDTKTGEMTFFDEQSGKAERDSEAWYTLDGVRLSGKPTKKGLYINNGKKIVIK